MGVALSLFSAACLCSCGEKEEANQIAPAAAEETAATEAPAASELSAEDAAAAAREAVYRQLLENIAPLVTANVGLPEFNEPAKIYLESLQRYDEALEGLAPSMDGVDIAARVAELTRNFGAHTKALEAAERALARFEALPEAERNTPEGMRRSSALYNSKGLCLLHLGRATDAIPCYEKALETDIAVLRQLGIGEESELVAGQPDANISRAVADVLGSYRCLGEAHVVAGDMEEARDIYKKGVETMTKLKHMDVNSGMGVAFVKLHGALGDLENRCGNDREALSSWLQAATLCQGIFNNSNRVIVKLQAKRFFDTLNPLITEKAQKLEKEAEARKAEAEALEAEAPAEPTPAS